MKTGIISAFNAHDFGTAMQAYALLTYLRNLGHTADVINYRHPATEEKYEIQKKPNKRLRSRVKYIVLCSVKGLRNPCLVRRRNRYEVFFKKHYEQTTRFDSYEQLYRTRFDYDAVFMCGRQITDAEVDLRPDPALSLGFADSKTICAGYAVSTGAEQPDDPERKVLAEYLTHLDYISAQGQKDREELEQLTGRTIETVYDPVVLLKPDDYRKLLLDRPCNREYIYTHIDGQPGKQKTLIKLAEKISKETGLPVLHNSHGHHFSNEAGEACSDGPDKTLTDIFHARYVVTQSYHVALLSLLFHKCVISIRQREKENPLELLLDSVGMSDHLAESGKDVKAGSLSGNFESFDSIIDRERNASEQFISKVLTGEKHTPRTNYLNTADPFTCCGCSACADACPAQAIEMEKDGEGFNRPVVHRDRCIHCGLCEIICPEKANPQNQENTKGEFDACAKDRMTRRKQLSGGVIIALGQYIVEHDGFVAGVCWKKAGVASYVITNRREDIEAFENHIYTEPEHDDIYRKTSDALKTGKPVLFIGSPCKIAGLKAYLHEDYGNLCTVELACKSISSPDILPICMRKKAGQTGSPVIAIAFDSRVGKNKRGITYRYENGTEERIPEEKDLFYRCYTRGYFARPACFRCAFNRDQTTGDLVIGNFRTNRRNGRSKFPEGSSCIKINTKHGAELIQRAEERLLMRPLAEKEAGQEPVCPVVYNVQRTSVICDIIECPERAEIIMRKALKYTGRPSGNS